MIDLDLLHNARNIIRRHLGLAAAAAFHLAQRLTPEERQKIVEAAAHSVADELGRVAANPAVDQAIADIVKQSQARDAAVAAAARSVTDQAAGHIVSGCFGRLPCPSCPATTAAPSDASPIGPTIVDSPLERDEPLGRQANASRHVVGPPDAIY